jgi:PAS domain-containing protein
MGATQALGPQDLTTLLDEMREGLQVIDTNWRYVFLNKAAAEHGRRPREELLGRTMMECYPGIDGSEIFAVLRRCMAERVSASMTREVHLTPAGVEQRFCWTVFRRKSTELQLPHPSSIPAPMEQSSETHP